MRVNPAIILALILTAIIGCGTWYSVEQQRVENSELVASVDGSGQQVSTTGLTANKKPISTVQRKKRVTTPKASIVSKADKPASENSGQSREITSPINKASEIMSADKIETNAKVKLDRVVVESGLKQTQRKSQLKQANTETSKVIVIDNPKVKRPTVISKPKTKQAAAKLAVKVATGANQLKAPAGSNYIIVFAARSAEKAKVVAQTANNRQADVVRVFKTRSGHFVVAAGPYGLKQLTENKKQLTAAKIAPDNSYYSAGQGFVNESHP